MRAGRGRRKSQMPMTARPSISSATFRRSSPSSPTSSRTAPPRSISAISASTSRNGGSCRCWRSSPAFPASRICHVIGFDKGPVSRTLSMLQKRGLVAIRTAPDDGRTHSISLTAKGRATHDKVIVAALERERRLLSVLKQGRAGSADRPAAPRPRQSRCRQGRRRPVGGPATTISCEARRSAPRVTRRRSVTRFCFRASIPPCETRQLDCFCGHH